MRELTDEELYIPIGSVLLSCLYCHRLLFLRLMKLTRINELGLVGGWGTITNATKISHGIYQYVKDYGSEYEIMKSYYPR